MAHATLSPSASSRWLQCPGSVQLIEQSDIPDTQSRASVEGTYAHALAELRAMKRFGVGEFSDDENVMAEFESNLMAEILADEFNFTENDIYEMGIHVETFLDHVQHRMEEHDYTPSVMLEQRLETSVEDCWGTSDVVLMSANQIEIIDFKYGQGVPVDAEGNTQLRIYGIGALEAFGDIVGETKEVIMTVVQPRLDSFSTEILTAAELRDWRDSYLRPRADLTRLDNPPFNPSETACQWCPVAGICRANFEATFGEEFGEPDEPIELEEAELLQPEEIARLLEKIPKVKKWMADVEKRALDLAYQQGVRIPGYKIVRSSGRRGISDGPGAINALLEAGHSIDDISTMKPETLGKLEKVVGGRKKLDELIGDYVTVSTGKESLVPESAKGESISPMKDAANDFKE